VAAVALLGPWSLDVIDHHSRERMFVDAAVCAYPLTLISTFCNVAFALLAAAAIDGRRMTVGEAFAGARSRLGASAIWALIATVVGTALRGLEQLPAVGGLAGRALEDASAPAALRRSAQTIRRSWGESVTGAVVVGSVFGLISVGSVIVGAVGVVWGHSGFAPAYLVAVAAAAALVLSAVVQTAVTQVFRLAVYRYATESGATGPFAATDLEDAFRPRARRFWQ
jgi:Family of unknown function (DUF6159)